MWEFGLTCACVLHSDKGHVKWEQRDATQTLSCMWAEVGSGWGGGAVGEEERVRAEANRKCWNWEL